CFFRQKECFFCAVFYFPSPPLPYQLISYFLLTCISYTDILKSDITSDDIVMGGYTLEKDEYVPLTESVYYILLTFKNTMHCYAVMQYISEISKERVKMGPGTLYGAIKTLLEKGWITLVEGESGSRRKEYVLTESGIE